MAKSQSVLWCEYWKFLDCFTDLATSEGLGKLEEYLKAKSEACKANMKNGVPLKRPVSCKCSSIGSPRGLECEDGVFDGSPSAPNSELVNNGRNTPCSRNRNVNVRRNFRNRLNLDESFQRTNENTQMKIDFENVSMDLKKMAVESTAFHVGTQKEDRENESSVKSQSPISPDFLNGSLDISNDSEDSLSGLIPDFQTLGLDEMRKSARDSASACVLSKRSPTEDRSYRDVETNETTEEISAFIEG